jgi:DNA-directed RNA polymerase subunit RPC12/RpoP
MFGETIYVCSKCGRHADDRHLHGWLIDVAKNPEKKFYREMVIRCPSCVTTYALRQAERGKSAIKS